jgi:hypothetical protein
MHFGLGLCHPRWVRLKEHGDVQAEKPIMRFKAGKCAGESCQRRRRLNNPYCDDCSPYDLDRRRASFA